MSTFEMWCASLDNVCSLLVAEPSQQLLACELPKRYGKATGDGVGIFLSLKAVASFQSDAGGAIVTYSCLRIASSFSLEALVVCIPHFKICSWMEAVPS